MTGLEQLPGSPLDPRPVPDAATAREQLGNRDLDGALVVDPGGTTDTLLGGLGGALIAGLALDTLPGGPAALLGPAR